MKQKTGRKLLGVLLALALTVGLMPGMGLTAYAADGVAIGNGGYPYGKNMTPSITFIVDVAASSGGVYQWYVSDSSDGSYSEVANTSGSFEANADSFETTFTPIDGKWYKCRINNEPQCETQPVMAKKIMADGIFPTEQWRIRSLKAIPDLMLSGRLMGRGSLKRAMTRIGISTLLRKPLQLQ